MTSISVFDVGVLISVIASSTSVIAGLLAYRRKAASDRIEVKFSNGRVLILSKSMSAAEIAGNLRAIQLKLASFEDAAHGRFDEELHESHSNV